MGDYRADIGVILGLYMGYIGIMEKKMETTITYWCYIGFRVSCSCCCTARWKKQSIKPLKVSCSVDFLGLLMELNHVRVARMQY